jgi:hypothetical protein
MLLVSWRLRWERRASAARGGRAMVRGVEVEVGPEQTGQLAGAQPDGQADDDHGVEAFALGGGQQGHGFSGSERSAGGGRLGPQHHGEGGDVADDQATALGVAERIGQDGAHPGDVGPGQAGLGLDGQELIDHLGGQRGERHLAQHRRDVDTDHLGVVAAGVVGADPPVDDRGQPVLQPLGDGDPGPGRIRL